MDFYNGFNPLTLRQAVEPSARKINSDIDGESWADFISNNQFNINFWEQLNPMWLSHIFSHTQADIACGPTAHTVFLGSQTLNIAKLL